MTVRGYQSLTFSDDQVHNAPRVISIHNILVINWLTFIACKANGKLGFMLGGLDNNSEVRVVTWSLDIMKKLESQ